jgi:uncharacterized membrane protein YgdD (TMEM256/DUF423 family)
VIRLGALLGFLGVAFGAFGAHGLRDRLANLGTLEVYRTAVLYQLVHAIALLAIGLGAQRLARPRVVGALWVAGTLLFSGSLYALALTGTHGFGAITPVGGVLFLAGWAVLAVAP